MVTSTAQGRQMAKKKLADQDGPEKSNTKMDNTILRKARMVALQRDMDLFDYLDGIVRAVVERDYARMIADEGKKGDN